MGEDKSYVAIAPCGCIKMACVDNPDHRRETAREVARCIRAGLEIQYIHTQSVRAYPWLCTEHQADLDAKRSVAGKQQKLEMGS